MVIADGINVKLGITDIETLEEMFDIGIYNPDTREWVEFEISKNRNDLFHFVHYYTSHPCDYLVTYNGIGFDQQVLEWIVDNHQKWIDLTNLEISSKIAQFAQKIIENGRYDIQPPYREHQFSIPALDVFRILHLDNEAKRTSLKWCEFMMNMDVEEMPVHFSKKGLTDEDIISTKTYRRHDIMATLGMLYLTLGQVEKIKEVNGGHELPELKDYKGKNKIQDRFDVKRETKLECLNWSDVKIGEEWNKLDYMLAEGIKDPYSLIPKSMKSIYGQKFKNFFPKTLEFTTLHLQKFAKEFGETVIKKPKMVGKRREKAQEFPIVVGSTKYTVAKGGIHSCEKNRKLIPSPEYILRDADVGSQYPNAIVKFEIYGPHLKITILEQYQGKIKKRIHYKNLAKELKGKGELEQSRIYSSIQEMLKLCLNGGYFGKLGQPGSFLEYQEGLLKCCIGNEIEILMAIEMMEEAGFQVLSGNTDGFVTLFPKDKEGLYNEICKKWEEKVGNVEMGKLEYTDFAGLWQESINHYIALKTDGTVKKKGRFCTELEIYKDKSERIIALAMEEYFINKKDPIEYIKNHKNIFDFCIGVKAFGDLYYEEQWEENGEVKVKRHKKLIRYYLSNKGTTLWKRGFNHEGKPMNNHVNAPNELGDLYITYFNTATEKKDYDINYSYYILETLKRIDKIEKTKMMEGYIKSLNEVKQMSLF